jgi:hypothetical protein
MNQTPKFPADVADAIALISAYLRTRSHSNQALIDKDGACIFGKFSPDIDQGWTSLGNASVLEGDR